MAYPAFHGIEDPLMQLGGHVTISYLCTESSDEVTVKHISFARVVCTGHKMLQWHYALWLHVRIDVRLSLGAHTDPNAGQKWAPSKRTFYAKGLLGKTQPKF